MGSEDLYIHVYICACTYIYKCTYTFIYPYTPPIQPRAYTLYVGVWGTSYTMWGGPKRGYKGAIWGPYPGSEGVPRSEGVLKMGGPEI